MDEQPELPLELPVTDNYKVEICKGPLFQEETLRSHIADDAYDALNLIEGLRDTYASRVGVIWQNEEVDGNGHLFGLAPEGVVYLIRVTPPLTTAQA